MNKAKRILSMILSRDGDIYDLPKHEIEEAINELDRARDNMQIKILELHASFKKEIKTMKIKFIEDVKNLKNID